MLRLWPIVRADFMREFGTPSALFIFLILPLIFTATLAGQLGSGEGNTTTPTNASIAIDVVQQDTGPLGPALVKAMEANNLAPKMVTALAGDSLGVIIPADFSARLLAGEPVSLTLQVKGTDSRTPSIRQAVGAARERLWLVVQTVRTGAAAAEKRGAFADEAAREAFIQDFMVQVIDLGQTPAAQAEIVWAGSEGSVLRNHVTDSEQASAGQLVTWVQVTLLGTSAILINEQLSGTLRRLMIMPVPGTVILGGKVLARFLLGLGQMAMLVLGGALLFNVGWSNNPPAVALVSVAFAAAISGLGLLLATIVKTPIQAGTANTGIAMAMAALGGGWWPMEITPPLYQQVVQILPTTWAMRAYTRILLHGAGIAELQTEILVLFGFAVFFFGLGLIRFRKFRV